MTGRAGALLAVVYLAAAATGARGQAADDPATAPVRRALAFLGREVPRWSREHHCFSCHNNGDAARALLEGRRKGFPIEADALTDTARWLARPDGWDRNGGEGPFSDRRLARVQFASALAQTLDVGLLNDRTPLREAARRLAAEQGEDGSWPIDDTSAVGSPAGYGRALATLSARNSLAAADEEAFRGPIARADRWLGARPIVSAHDAAISLLAGPSRAVAPGDADRRRLALERLRAARSSDGGWGPYPNSPPEPFDTALVLIALARIDSTPDIADLLRRGRGWLVSAQRPDGSWVETTRPAGAESYAQRISTTGWATLALLVTGKGTHDQ